MKFGDKNEGGVAFQTLKIKDKSIKNQCFFILLTFILDNGENYFGKLPKKN